MRDFDNPLGLADYTTYDDIVECATNNDFCLRCNSYISWIDKVGKCDCSKWKEGIYSLIPDFVNDEHE